MCKESMDGSYYSVAHRRENQALERQMQGSARVGSREGQGKKERKNKNIRSPEIPISGQGIVRVSGSTQGSGGRTVQPKYVIYGEVGRNL